MIPRWRRELNSNPHGTFSAARGRSGLESGLKNYVAACGFVLRIVQRGNLEEFTFWVYRGCR